MVNSVPVVVVISLALVGAISNSPGCQSVIIKDHYEYLFPVGFCSIYPQNSFEIYPKGIWMITCSNNDENNNAYISFYDNMECSGTAVSTRLVSSYYNNMTTLNVTIDAFCGSDLKGCEIISNDAYSGGGLDCDDTDDISLDDNVTFSRTASVTNYCFTDTQKSDKYVCNDGVPGQVQYENTDCSGAGTLNNFTDYCSEANEWDPSFRGTFLCGEISLSSNGNDNDISNGNKIYITWFVLLHSWMMFVFCGIGL